MEVRKIQGHLFMNEIEEEILNNHGYLIRQKKELDNLNKDLNDTITNAALLLTIAGSDHLKQILRDR